MKDSQSSDFTAFIGNRKLASGPLEEVALAAKRAIDRGVPQPVIIYNDQTGRAMDIDSHGRDAEVLTRLARPAPPESPVARRRGRPKLGVIAREVTLLPRHWQWLGAQPGGASVAIRKLVEAARRATQEADQRRQKQEAAHHFMSAMVRDLPNFDEATRALFANAHDDFARLSAHWPKDVREHATRLGFEPGSASTAEPGCPAG
jgi:hypothetical protein